VRINNGEDHRVLIGAYDRDVVERGRAAVLASLEEGMKKMDFDKLMTCKTASQGFAKEGPKKEESRLDRPRFDCSRVEGPRMSGVRGH
jgi:hypothetical protein